MIRILLCVLAFLAATRAPAQVPPAPAPPSAQDSVKDDRPELRADLEALDKAIKDPKQDTDSAKKIAALSHEFATSGPKDRQRLLKSISALVTGHRPDNPPTTLQVAAAEALGEMGPDSEAPLTKAFGDVSLKKNDHVLIAMSHALIALDTKTSLDAALELLNDRELRVMCAAVSALADVGDKSLPERKKTARAILVRLRLRPLAGDKQEKESVRLNVESRAWDQSMATLCRVTGHKEADLAAWEQWFNTNKDKDWPKGS
jgi:HEAT repeat protein